VEIRTSFFASELTSSVTAKSLLNGIHIVRIATQVQMIAFLNVLDDWLNDHPKVPSPASIGV
jgi:RAD51-like protein 2